MTVWILADDRMGNVNQLLGIAEALGVPFERIDIRYNGWIRLPNRLRGATLIGIRNDDVKKRLQGDNTWPDVVLSAGRRAFPVARYIRHRSGGRTRIVQLMNPGRTLEKKADLLVLPAHDGRKAEGNIMVVVGTPHRVGRERLALERAKWEPVFRAYPHPRVSLIVGGATKDKPFTVAAAQALAAGVRARGAASILVTTSRRTPPEVVAVLKRELPAPLYFYQFGEAGENPYFGLLAAGDEVVVTGDSMSMCSECCATGLPVSIFAPDEMMSAKHKRFHQALYAAGLAVPLGEKPEAPAFLLNPAAEIAERIRASGWIKK